MIKKSIFPEEINLVLQMGYGKMGQKGKGIHLRQFSRAFIFDDGKNRMVFISVDCAMIGHGLRREVSGRFPVYCGEWR